MPPRSRPVYTENVLMPSTPALMEERREVEERGLVVKTAQEIVEPAAEVPDKSHDNTTELMVVNDAEGNGGIANWRR